MKGRTRKIDEELAALVRMRDNEIDTSDIPEVTDWSGAVIGKFYRPVKEAVSLRIDADVLAWLRKQGPGYQTRINELLRNAMTARTSASQSRDVSDHKKKAGSCRSYRFPALEKHSELQKCTEIAMSISERHCLFAVGQ